MQFTSEIAERNNPSLPFPSNKAEISGRKVR